MLDIAGELVPVKTIELLPRDLRRGKACADWTLGRRWDADGMDAGGMNGQRDTAR